MILLFAANEYRRYTYHRQNWRVYQNSINALTTEYIKLYLKECVQDEEYPGRIMTGLVTETEVVVSLVLLGQHGLRWWGPKVDLASEQ